jgi:hypothetical protein
MGRRREVRVSETLVTSARQFFPVGGSPDGRPSYELFESRPLAAARELFARWFDESPEAEPGTGIKVWITIDLPFFLPSRFYALLVEDYVEIIDVTIEDPQDYWAMVYNDPVD